MDDALERLERFINAEERALREAFEWILREMCSYAKTNGAWTDRTGNLRNSISVNMELMKEWKASATKIEALEAIKKQNETPVIVVEGDDYVGCLSCGMEYGIWMETKQGISVLTGTIDKFEPLIEKYFKDKMSVEKLDLDEAASVAYLTHQTNKQFGRW